MKILFLYNLPLIPYKGGIERVSNILAEEFKKEGHEVFFVSTTKNIDLFNNSSFKQYYLDFQDPDFIKNFHNLLKEHTPQVIINQALDKKSYILLESLKRIRDSKIPLPVIFSVFHNRPYPIDGIARKFKTLTYPKTLKGYFFKYIGLIYPSFYSNARNKEDTTTFKNFQNVSDKLFLLSERFIPRLQKFFPEFDKNKVDAINNPNTFKLPEINNIRKDNLIIFVGRLLDPQKNVKNFIDLWNNFHKSHSTWHAKIIGEGEHRGIFEKYAKKRGTLNLEFIGNQKNVDEYYKKAKFICVTSLYEGWGMVITEAMAYECIPVVFDSYESLHDIIKDNVTGIIAKPFSIQEMSTKLSSIADNEIKRIRIAKEGKHYIDKFNSKAIASIWLNKILKEINS